ncbi:hypothetical protein AJ79_07151 [Helicocarpus griseus UAMH5409]|uniref:3-oxoacyl-[acyl-carrier-protein] reductase n=1 Tax=Helicocarpus griseus UAMH5409 TaxID=1447875 RepID=A0A2B7X6A5_9EURO|nr:hypothetical protein AJ79_07151 [Helicocarpus griseus UAMH5409]
MPPRLPHGLVVGCCRATAIRSPPAKIATCIYPNSSGQAIKPELAAGLISCRPRWLQASRAFSTVHDAAKQTKQSLSQSSPPIPPLQGLTCMVTGGSSGIGFAIASRFLREGAKRVVIVGRSRGRLEEAVRRLAKEEGHDAGQLSYTKQEGTKDEVPSSNGVDVRDPPKKVAAPIQNKEFDNVIHDQPRNDITGPRDCEIYNMGSRFTLAVGDVGNPAFWGEEVKKLMDTIDILTNAAGISHSSLLSLTTEEDITDMLRTNLQGTIYACRTMARRIMRSRSRQKSQTIESFTKCIINVSSLHATKGGVGAATYASTKAGVIALTRAIAAEGGAFGAAARLRANVIVPGYVETRMVGDLNPQVREQALKAIPLRRFGTAEEVADAAVFLARNQYANNCVLNLDGGLSAV